MLRLPPQLSMPMIFPEALNLPNGPVKEPPLALKAAYAAGKRTTRSCAHQPAARLIHPWQVPLATLQKPENQVSPNVVG